MEEQFSPEEIALRKAKNVARKDRAEHLEAELYNIAMDPETPAPTRIMAIDKALDRLKGKPAQPVPEGADSGSITVRITGGLPDLKPVPVIESSVCPT